LGCSLTGISLISSRNRIRHRLFRTVVGAQHLVAEILEHDLQDALHLIFVVDDQSRALLDNAPGWIVVDLAAQVRVSR
jgi:hypothetical protein